jgi:hypothetical protein
MRIMFDKDRDVAFVQLKDVWEASPGGGSSMLVPPHFPFRVDVYYDEEERLEMISVENASKCLHPDALELAVPFEPFPPMPPGWEGREPPSPPDSASV